MNSSIVNVIASVQVTGSFRSVNKGNPQPKKGQELSVSVSVFGQSECIGVCKWNGREAMLEDVNGRSMSMTASESVLCSKNSFRVTAPCFLVIPVGNGRVTVEGEVSFMPLPEQQRIN